MQKKINIGIWVVVLFLFGFLLCRNVLYRQQVKEYQITGRYFGEDVKVKIYLKNDKKVKSIFKKVESILNMYDEFTTTDTKTQEINLYTLNHSDQLEVSLTKNQFEFLSYGKKWYEKSNHLINIQMNNVISDWETYFNRGVFPTQLELDLMKLPEVNDIELKDNFIKWTDSLALNTESYEKGYTIQKIEQYLKQESVESYLIQIGSNITVGEHYSSSTYKIVLENPINGEIDTTLSLKNKSIVTKGSYQKQVTMESDKTYTTMLSPETKQPAMKVASVTVISSDALFSDTLSSILFQMEIEEGKAYLKDYRDVEVIWRTLDGKTVKTGKVNDWLKKEKS